MSYVVQLCLIRGDVVVVQLADIDELGRQVGPLVEVEAKVSADLRAAIDAHIAEAITAQVAVIADAKTAREQDPTAPVILVADLKPKSADAEAVVDHVA